MDDAVREEYEKAVQKRDELKQSLERLKEEDPGDSYNIMITRDRLAYWEGRAEGLKFAMDHIER